MTEKIKFEQEYIFKTSPKVLTNLLMTPSGLSEWFADDVDIKDDIFTFYWNGSEESARLLSKKNNEFIKFRWLEDEEEGIDSYVEMRYTVDPMTKEVVFNLTSFATEDEMEEVQLYWENAIGDLRRMIGA
ncbi:MAG: START-like domain-containing protein [Crocinitomicaceae bacterium]|nr:START-like domain-containing protein [Crocinitomicaceae bacterium]